MQILICCMLLFGAHVGLLAFIWRRAWKGEGGAKKISGLNMYARCIFLWSWVYRIVQKLEWLVLWNKFWIPGWLIFLWRGSRLQTLWHASCRGGHQPLKITHKHAHIWIVETRRARNGYTSTSTERETDTMVLTSCSAKLVSCWIKQSRNNLHIKNASLPLSTLVCYK